MIVIFDFWMMDSTILRFTMSAIIPRCFCISHFLCSMIPGVCSMFYVLLYFRISVFPMLLFSYVAIWLFCYFATPQKKRQQTTERCLCPSVPPFVRQSVCGGGGAVPLSRRSVASLPLCLALFLPLSLSLFVRLLGLAARCTNHAMLSVSVSASLFLSLSLCLSVFLRPPFLPSLLRCWFGCPCAPNTLTNHGLFCATRTHDSFIAQHQAASSSRVLRTSQLD